MNRSRVIGYSLFLALLLTAGCANSLTRVKRSFEEGAVSGFDAARLDGLQADADEVAQQSGEYGAEGVAQAGLLVSYACVQAGEIDRAETALQRVELLVDVASLSPSNQALLAVVRADIDYEKALSLAMDDIDVNREAMEAHLAAAVHTYDQAGNSPVFASEPLLRQVFALRAADILISAGNLWRLWDTQKADEFYVQATETALEAIELDDALKARLVERALEATRLRKTLQAPES